MTKPPTSYFSLSDLRKSIDEHPSPLFTLTKAQMEALVGRLEMAACANAALSALAAGVVKEGEKL